MKVALLGATGFVGSALLKEALDRGHSDQALLGRPSMSNVSAANVYLDGLP